MLKCYVMVGIPGAGKSTEAGRIAERENAIVVSSDAIKKEVNGDEADQSNLEKVFEIVTERVEKALSEKRNVVIDSANTTVFGRESWIDKLASYEAETIAVYMKTPFELCLKRQALRERKVPEEVIMKMRATLTVPSYSEGWDDIITVLPDGTRH